VVRVAGNVIDDIVLASIEYAAEHLHTPLLIVLGHTSGHRGGCGELKRR
jgi:carbonic anhydrase